MPKISITLLLIASCVIVSLIGFMAMRDRRRRPYFVFIPSRLDDPRSWVGLFVSHFSHADFGHLLVNMFALYIFGPKVESELGAMLYLIVYAASGLFGTFAVYLFRHNDTRYSALGASGAIAGIVFASVVVEPTARLMIMPIPVPIAAPLFALGYLVLSSLKMGGNDGVAHEAHLGGALAGLALSGVLFDKGFGPLLRVLNQLIS